MENALLEKNKRYIIIKMNYLTIQKLMHLYDKDKLTRDDFKEKLLKLKTRLEVDYKRLIEIDKRIEILEKANNLDILVIEYFCYYSYFEAAKELSFKLKLNFDIENYIDIKNIINDIENEDFTSLERILASNRSHVRRLKINYQKYTFTPNDLQCLIKIKHFLKAAPENKEEAIAYLQNEFKEVNDEIKAFLPALVLDQSKYESCLPIDLINQFSKICLCFLYTIYNLPAVSRLEKRIMVALSCLKTPQCTTNPAPNCTACIPHLKQLSVLLPFCKRDTSLMLCSGTKKVMDDSNWPYLFETGYLYSEEYIKSTCYSYLCKKTGRVCRKEPHRCFFI